MKVYRIILFLILSLVGVNLSITAQTNINGVINDYSRVIDVTNPQCSPCDTTIPCLNKVTVDQPDFFSVGDKCLIIQMKGATIDPTNGIGGGDITDIGNAGNYEFFNIKEIRGNDIYPERQLIREYDAPGLVQLVRVPTYQGDVIVDGELTATPWDPALSIGGVLALFVEGDLTLNADLNVEGLGFKGVVVAVSAPLTTDNCNTNPIDQMMKAAAADDVCPKGNGIVVDDPALNGGRAPRANGGGGGVGGDSGGGGGSNYGAGGNGGDRWCEQTLRAGGIGGHTLLPYLNNNKVFLGGAGGPGFVTSGNSAQAANGGGIIVLKANTINGNGRTINASGTSPSALGTGIDGGGGGGAGGTIMLNGQGVVGNLNVLINGGDGQNLGTPTLHGPGGGGGGGALLHTLAPFPATVTVDLTGGVAGVHTGGNSTNSNNGTDGQEGGVVYVEDIIREFNVGEILVEDPSCGQCDGSIEFKDFNATSDLTYSIDEGATFLTNVTFNDLCADSFYVQVLDQDGCVFDTIIETEGTTGGLPIDLGDDQLICEGESVEIGVDNVPLISYQWSTGETTSKITIKDAGIYTLTVGDGSGCDVSDSMELVVEAYPVLTLQNDTAICDGEEVVFEAGLNDLSYTWSNGDTTASITTGIAGQYWLEVSTPNNCIDRDTVNLSVTAPFVELPDDIYVCENELPVEVVGKGNNFNQILWEHGATTLITEINAAGTFIVGVSDENNCTATDTIVIETEEVPDLVLQNDTALCGGQSITFNAGLPGLTYLWSNGETTESITTSKAGVYWLEVASPNNCLDRDTVELSITAPDIDLPDDISVCDDMLPVEVIGIATDYDKVSWNSGETVLAISVDQAGEYIVEVSDVNDCKAWDTIVVYTEEVPDLKLPNDTGVCVGEEVTFLSGFTDLNHEWSDGSTEISYTTGDAGDYWLKVSTPLGCFDVDTVTLTVTQPTVSLPADTSICADEFPFDVIGKGTNFTTVTWNDGNLNLMNTITKDGTYSILAIDENNCLAMDTMEVYSEDIPDVDLGPDLKFCSGESKKIGVGLDNSLFFNWNYGWENSIVDVDATGEYILNVSTPLGCSNSDTINVLVKEAPFIVMTNDTTICFDDLPLYRITAATNGTSWFWSTGDTTESILVPSSGTYSVTVMNEALCSHRDEVKIKNDCPWAIYVPNAFTPNGDGVNDDFQVKHYNLMSYQIYIFNRWGQLIFDSDHEYKYWDGTFLNNEVQEDVYVYKIIFSYDSYGKEEFGQKVGRVSLVR